MKLTHKYKVWLMLEAETPLSLGSGRESITVDRLVARNAAGFPYIQGTSLAGVLRHSLESCIESHDLNSLFGFADKDKGQGSRIIINSAHLLAHDGVQVLEAVPIVDLSNEYYSNLQNLPERDYVSISDKGTANKGGKFDAELLHKGVRFVTSFELAGTPEDQVIWMKILAQMGNPTFRIGGGTRKGYGKLKVVKLANKAWDLTTNEGIENYLATDNSLKLPSSIVWSEPTNQALIVIGYTSYSISLRAKDFFLFGAGYGDDEADATYKTEKYFEWGSGRPELVNEPCIIISATSVKGALRHRVAYHHNLNNGVFADQSSESEKDYRAELNKNLEKKVNWEQFEASSIDQLEMMLKTLEQLRFSAVNPFVYDNKPKVENEAVKTLFGYASDSEGEEQTGQRGNVLLQDVYLGPAIETAEKVFDHVKIDRYTGGATDGALFQEKTISYQNDIEMTIWVKNEALLDVNVRNAWHHTLDDLCNARLALGGRTTKGHGLFTGTYTKTEN